MTEREALKLARTALGVQLDALLGKAGHLRNDDRRRYAENGIKAIDEALAQPEQDPVTEVNDWSNWRDMVVVNIMRHGDINKHLARKLANHFQKAIPQRKPLTDEKVNKLVDDEDWYNDPHGFVRVIEAAHGIKGEA